MKNIQEIEYCNLELTFEKKQAFELIYSIVGNQYSIVENSGYMIIYVYLEEEAVKLKFKKHGSHIRLMGKNYCFQSDIMFEIMDRLIYESKGHAVIKRVGQRAIYIETVIFGEVVAITEIKGSYKKVLYQKKYILTGEDLEKLWTSTSVEERIEIWKLEVDYALAWLAEALKGKNEVLIIQYKIELQRLNRERISLEI